MLVAPHMARTLTRHLLTQALIVVKLRLVQLLAWICALLLASLALVAMIALFILLALLVLLASSLLLLLGALLLFVCSFSLLVAAEQAIRGWEGASARGTQLHRMASATWR